MYLILRKDAIFNDLPYKLKEETRFHEKNISEQLYKDYSNFKNKIFENIVKKNPDIDKLTLFKKITKIIRYFNVCLCNVFIKTAIFVNI